MESGLVLSSVSTLGLRGHSLDHSTAWNSEVALASAVGDNWDGQGCVGQSRKVCLRAWTILVCDFRLGMGKEGLLPPCNLLRHFLVFGYLLFEPWDPGFLESLLITPCLGNPTLNPSWVALLPCRC